MPSAGDWDEPEGLLNLVTESNSRVAVCSNPGFYSGASLDCSRHLTHAGPQADRYVEAPHHTSNTPAEPPVLHRLGDVVGLNPRAPAQVGEGMHSFAPAADPTQLFWMACRSLVASTSSSACCTAQMACQTRRSGFWLSASRHLTAPKEHTLTIVNSASVVASWKGFGQDGLGVDLLSRRGTLVGGGSQCEDSPERYH